MGKSNIFDDNREMSIKGGQVKSSVTSLDWLGRYGMVLVRLIIGYLWITQLEWKLPPQFGCPADFAVSSSLNARTSGLCDWTGLMGVYSKVPMHAAFVNNVVIPNISWMGWLIFLMEAFIAVSLIFGLFTRLGAIVGFIQAVNLYIGLTAIPFEWYWTYGMLYTLHMVFFFVPPGRTLGVDAWLRPRLRAGAQQGSGLARLFYWLT
jgi:thiosulfate dehydrogenase [quinone] large subunit